MRNTLILLAVFLFGVYGIWQVQANDLNARLTDTVLAADTTALGAWEKTVYTPKYRIAQYCYLGFYWRVTEGYYNTAGSGTYDSMDVNFQVSHNGIDNWTTLLLDSSAVAQDSGWANLFLDCSDSIMGDWGRGMLRYRDSTLADSPDSLGNIRDLELDLWLMGRE